MIKVLFICHGNICRSTMAESMFTDMVKQKGLSELFEIDSAATHDDEISFDGVGNPPYYGTVNKLKAVGIPVIPHEARMMTAEDYQKFDYLIGMDENNIYDMKRIAHGDRKQKIYLMLSFAGVNREVADPWFTRNFEATYEDLKIGLTAFFEFLKEREGEKYPELIQS